MESRFGGEGAALDRQVDAFQPRAVEVAGGVAEDHETVAVLPRHREIAAFGDGLRAGGDHLAALENPADRGMQLETLELVMRIERRVLVIETDDQADVDDAVAHAVDERAAERVEIERPAHRVNHGAGGEAIVGKLPQLL